MRWYEVHGRKDLPWRNTPDAYAIYVSETMLQQTQVKTVLDRFYGPFMARFPTLSALADAPQEDVLSVWQGLGYYSRARNMQKAAQACGGKLPEDVEALMALPGIGRNTAHAVAAFGFYKPYAVMEANVKRVLCRILALEAPVERELWQQAAALLDVKNPFDYNQAMMDVGAMVCTKRAPACGVCPASGICRGKDAPERYPAPKRAKAVKVRRETIWVVQDSKGRVYATPRETRFLHGLYHFAQTPADAETLRLEGRELARLRAMQLGQVKQVYSHFTLEADVVLAQAGAVSGNGWYSREVLEDLPMSMAERKVLALLDSALAKSKAG
ncbi:MAG: A/G-specific adenine glycosylase [Rickettsiales bacterium]|nr:A/G-specific adenine glycosylase [Rickettsiales bacterium]